MWLSPTKLLITWTHYTHLDELYIINWGSWFVASGIIVELEGTRTSLLGTWRRLHMTGQSTRWVATPSEFTNVAVGYIISVSTTPARETIGRQISTQEWAYAELKLDQDTSQADPHAPTPKGGGAFHPCDSDCWSQVRCGGDKGSRHALTVQLPKWRLLLGLL